MKTGRYLHAQQRKRANKQVKFLRVRLRRLQRDIRRKMASAVAMAERQRERLEVALAKAWRIAQQRRGDPGYLYSWHATEVECISKGKARAPYEFGCKVSVATNLHPAKGGHLYFACPGAARKSVRRPYPGGGTGRYTQDRGACAATRGRRSRIQGASHHAATHGGVPRIRTTTRRDGNHQTMAETPRGRGTGHRSR